MRRLNWPCVIERPRAADAPSDLLRVGEILKAVRKEGDAAVLRYTGEFESCRLAALKVPAEKLREATSRISKAQRDALVRAKSNIELFHAKQGFRSYATTVEEGIFVERVVRPLRRVGIYVPAGSAPLPSSLLMAAVPARLAGCEELVVCTPRGADGEVAPATLAAATLCGIGEVYQVGGAQAIAAMAYGTETIRRVDKIVGPGSRWVTMAKSLVSQDECGASIDMPAGPSEVMVVVDSTASAEFVASDLLSQAEHGADSHVVVVTLEEAMLPSIEGQINAQLAKLLRSEVATVAMSHAVAVVCLSKAEALAAVDAYAPEHLILHVEKPQEWVPLVRRAGSVFCGPWTPETAGDYASGSNHVLPTGGWARSYSGLGVESFQRTMTVQTMTPSGLHSLGPTLTTLAKLEGLDAHAAAVQVRVDGLQSSAKTADTFDLPLRVRVEDLRPYASAAALGRANGARLHANELSEQDAPDPRWNRYPEPQPTALCEQLAELYRVGSSQILITRGADEAIDLTVKTFGGEGERILVTPPTYGYYATVAHSYGCPILPIPLRSDAGFAPDMDRLADAIGGVKIAFLCNPNNPTGRAWTRAEILKVLEASRRRALVVIDEAYAEFSPSRSSVDLITEWPNLLVLRTLSKAWGMAGLRIGAVLGQGRILAKLRLMAAPYPIASASAMAALTLVGKDAQAKLEARVAGIRAEAQGLCERLRTFGNVLEVLPSEGNFVFVRVADVKGLVDGLAQAGILIRDRSLDFPGAVRVSVGSAEENAALLAAWRGLV